MSSDPTIFWKRVVAGIVIAIGIVLTIRLGLIAWDSFRVHEPQTLEEVREILVQGAKAEREDWERRWRESGHPPPRGGFDAAWQAARAELTEEDALPSTLE